MTMFLDINYSYNEVSVGQRIETAIAHVLAIPERVLQVIVQLAKLIIFGFISALNFGRSKLFNAEVSFALKRFVCNLAGIGNSLIGIFAPINAAEWQGAVFRGLLYWDITRDYGHYSKNAWAASVLSI